MFLIIFILREGIMGMSRLIDIGIVGVIWNAIVRMDYQTLLISRLRFCVHVFGGLSCCFSWVVGDSFVYIMGRFSV